MSFMGDVEVTYPIKDKHLSRKYYGGYDLLQKVIEREFIMTQSTLSVTSRCSNKKTHLIYQLTFPEGLRLMGSFILR